MRDELIRMIVEDGETLDCPMYKIASFEITFRSLACHTVDQVLFQPVP